MDIELIKLLDEVIDIFDKSYLIKRIQELKLDIYNDSILKDKLSLLNKTNQYDSKYLELKQDIYSDPKINEFKKKESELILITMAINKRLNSLTRKKGCFHENN